jgi:hypothetical protein
MADLLRGIFGTNKADNVNEQTNSFVYKNSFSFIQSHSQTISQVGINSNDVSFEGSHLIGCPVQISQSIDANVTASGVLSSNDTTTLLNNIKNSLNSNIAQGADQANGWGTIGTYNDSKNTTRVKNEVSNEIDTLIQNNTIQSIFQNLTNNNKIDLNNTTIDCTKGGEIVLTQDILCALSANLVSTSVTTTLLDNSFINDYLTSLSQAAEQHNQGVGAGLADAFNGLGDFIKKSGTTLIIIGVIIVVCIILYLIISRQQATSAASVVAGKPRTK